MDFITTGFGSKERLAIFRRGYFFFRLLDRREWEVWVVRLGQVKLEGDGGSIATLEFARGVFSTSSVAHDAYSVPSRRGALEEMGLG